MWRKLVLFLAFCILISGSAFAYELEGSSTTEPPPGSQDTYFFDLDAAWTFSNGEPGTTGPSVFYGEEVVKYQDGSVVNTWEDQPNGDGSIIKNYVSGGEGLDNWGDGERQQTRISISDSVVRSNYKNIEYLVTPPHPDADQTENRCGDTVHNDGNDESSCPEDYGLPSDSLDTTSESSSYDSETLYDTFLDEVGRYDINDISGVSGVGDGSDDTDDTILYDLDYTATPFNASERNTDASDDIRDICKNVDDGDCSDDSYTYEDEDWEHTPDFFMKDPNDDGNYEEIWMVYPEKTGDPVEIGTVTDHGLTERTVDDYVNSHSYSGSCGGHANCSSGSVGGSDACDSRGEGRDRAQELADAEKTLEPTTQTYLTDSEGTHGWDADPQDNDIDITVDHHDEGGSSPVSWWSGSDCGGNFPDDSCSPSGYGCSVSGGGTYYTPSDYTFYNDYRESTKTYYYQEIELKTKKIFDVNYAENPNGAPMTYSEDALFWDDTFKSNSGASTVTYGPGSRSLLSKWTDGNTGYYSWEISQNSNPLSNDPAVSISSFSLNRDGNEFYVERDSFETYDADGPYGESDGYVAIRHDVNNKGTASESKDGSDFQIVGTTPLFSDQETTTDGTSTNFVNYDPGSQPGWLSGCPRDQIKCVASVDLALQNIENWDSPSPDGGDVITTQTDTYAIDKSLSVCKMYENLAGSDGYDLDNFQSTSCQFTGGPGGGGGGGTCDEDPSECDTGPGTRMHTMEGPEVNEDRFSGALEDSVQDDYKTRVDHSDCVYKGEDVPEGTVANVASESYSSYETGTDSPDWEVCLNIHDAGPYDDVDNGYHDTGAHEFGGQWYDLDDSRVDYYLRPGNDGGESDQDGVGHSLIEDATEDQRNNASHISYYYRKNPNPYHPEWNPRGFTTSGGERDYYYGLAIEQDCDQDLDGCDDSGKTESDSAGIEQQFHYTFLWKNHGTTVEDYANVRGPPL